MKAIKLTYVLAGVLALTFIVTGCQKRPGTVMPINKQTQQIRPGDPIEGTAINPTEPGVIGEPGTPMNPPPWLESAEEDREALKAHVVHFDYDSSAIRTADQANVEAVASYLKGNSDVGVRVDGHCDERGTEGYNDSLGERRAAALREALIGLGANPDLVITRSLGERQPIDPAQNESAYAQNRRGEFIVLRKK